MPKVTYPTKKQGCTGYSASVLSTTVPANFHLILQHKSTGSNGIIRPLKKNFNDQLKTSRFIDFNDWLNIYSNNFEVITKYKYKEKWKYFGNKLIKISEK